MSIKDFFRAEWAGVADAWERWGPAVRQQSAAATAWLLRMAQIGPGAAVLDLASGTGDPALALAREVGATGRVVATDLVEGAVAFAARAAVTAGLTNVETCVADMEALPFADATFDAVTCRLGLMFCPAPGKALTEARRVLRPGGRAAFVVWGSPRQPLFEATLGQVRRALAPGATGGLPQQRTEPSWPAESHSDASPGPFRFADPAELSRALIGAGFSDVLCEQRVVPWPFPGSGAAWWRMFVDLGGPTLQSQLEALDVRTRRALAEQIAAALDAHESPGNTRDPGAWLVGAVGRRSAASGQAP